MTHTPPKKLTKRQQLVLNYIIDHIEQWGYPPTIREIGDHLDIKSTNGVNDHLKALERKGYLIRQDAKSRAIKPVLNAIGEPIEEEDNDQVILEDVQQIPIVGRIAAGVPITALENREDVFTIGQGVLPRADGIFALVVKGDSMIEDGIHNGDTIFIKQQKDAQTGQIVAAMIDGEATVKRFYHEGHRIRLQPSNSSMEPIYVSAQEEPEILGVVVGLYRQY